MKIKTYLPLVLVASVLLLAGCTSGGGTGKDCGTDSTCLREAAAKCELAFGTITQENEQMKMKMFMQVKGGTMSECEYYFRIDSLEYPSGITEAQKNLMNSFLLGKDFTCKIAVTEQLTFDQMVNSGKCKGSLIDIIKTVGQGNTSP